MIRMLVLVVAISTLSIVPALAELSTYKCNAEGKPSVVKIDDVKNTLQWQGNVYKIKKQPDCVNSGWRAQREGQFFDFCKSTQGVADFEKNGKKVDCDLQH